MTENLFSDDQTEIVNFEDLVGPDKKYKTNEDAAKALVEKDRFIEQLKNENGTFRTELQARTSLEEIVNGLKPTNGEPRPTPPIEPGSKQDDPAPTDLKAEVQRLLAEERKTTDRAQNLAKAKAAAKERFGGDYSATLRQIAQSLGVSDNFLNDVAASSPNAFAALISNVQADDTRPSAPPANAIDSTRQFTPNANRKNQAYYTNLRKTDLNTYLSKRVQNEMHKEAMLQGSKFFE